MAVRLSHYAPAALYPSGRYLVLISVRGLVDSKAIVPLEGLGKLKKSTSLGLDPATFRLVAQSLNQLRHRVPNSLTYSERSRYCELLELLMRFVLKSQ
jgi:hypothetical protein